MDTLRGVFPPPSKLLIRIEIKRKNFVTLNSLVEVPPKRDFLKENVMKIRSLQRNVAITKQPIPPVVKGPLPLKAGPQIPARNNPNPRSSVMTIKGPPTNMYKASSETSVASLGLTGGGRLIGAKLGSRTMLIPSIMESPSRDQSCQTTDPTNSMFYKDVTIRYPSTTVLDSLGNQQTNYNRSPRINYFSPVTIRSRGEGGRGDENSNRLSGNFSKRNDYLENGQISPKVPFIVQPDDDDDYDEYGNDPEIEELLENQQNENEKVNDVRRFDDDDYFFLLITYIFRN